MKKTISKWRNSVLKRVGGPGTSGVAILLAGALVMWGVPPQQAMTAGQVGAEIYETMKGGRHGEESTENQ